MTVQTPQDGRARAALAVLAVIVVGAAVPGCDCRTPRGKPWRHEQDPQALAAAQPRSPALVQGDQPGAALVGREHTLRVHVDAEPRALNPLTAPSVWARRIALGPVFETLIRYEPPDGGAGTGPGRYAPSLARSWRVARGGNEIRIELAPGVTFHDGRPLTAMDVQFTLDAIRDPRNKIDHLRSLLDDVWAVEIVTSRQLNIVLERPNGWVLRALAEIPILPRHVYEGNLSAGGKIVGSGPWQLASWKDGVVHLTRYGGYWGPPPAIDDLEFVYEPDAARALTEAKRGAFDLVPALIPAHWPEQASAPGIASSFTALELAPPRLRYVAFNCARSPTDDPRVRQAISMLVDRAAIARDAFDGLARPVAGPVWPGGLGDGPAPPAPPFDPTAAGRLLDSAGWIDTDKDGVRDRAGARLVVDALLVERPDPPPGPRKVDPEQGAILEALRRAGIQVIVRDGPEAVVMGRVRAGDFGFSLLEVALPVDLDLSPLLGSGGALDFGACGSRRIDQALAALESAWEPAARVPHTAELAAAIVETWPIAGVVAPAPQGLVHRRVQGVVVWDGWIDLRRLSLTAEETGEGDR